MISHFKLFVFLILIYNNNITLFDTSVYLVLFKASTKKSRFGDAVSIIYVTNLMSTKHNYPIIYEFFNNSHELAINSTIKEHQKLFDKKELRKFEIKHLRHLNFAKNKKDVIYEIRIDFYDKYLNELFEHKLKAIKMLRQLIKLDRPIHFDYKLKKKTINIAAHVRKGAGFDLPLISKNGLNKVDYQTNEEPADASLLANNYKKRKFFYSDLRWPYKFPPDSFYVKQIAKIAKIFPNKRLHVHIFTDDHAPSKIAKEYKKALHNYNVTFSFRKKDNHHAKNVVDDFFAMAQFDFLIRPVSSFSQNAELLGNFKLVFVPKHGIWVNQKLLIIDKISIFS